MEYAKFDKSLLEEYKKILVENQYGEMPKPPVKVLSNIKRQKTDFAGKAVLTDYFLRPELANGERLIFPITTCFPVNAKNNKTIIFISMEVEDGPVKLNVEDKLPNRYLPVEEIIDRGWNVINFNILNCINNSGRLDYNNNVLLRNECPETGKMMFWSWVVSRIYEFVSTLEEVDAKNVGVIGNERAGRIAMAAATFDERIAFVHANCTGTTGACLYESQTEQSQTIENVIMWFGWAFNKKFHEYFEKGEKRPFDQHLHGYLIAPRPFSVGCAEDDLFTNPTGSFDFCKAISNAYDSYGEKGFIAPDKFKVDEKYHDGKVGYYCRKGNHYLSRTDWNNALDFFDKNLNK